MDLLNNENKCRRCGKMYPHEGEHLIIIREFVHQINKQRQMRRQVINHLTGVSLSQLIQIVKLLKV